MRTSKLYAPLAYAGALPLVFCAVLLALGIDSLPILGSVSLIAKTYSLAIVAFMSGSHWGTWQQQKNLFSPPLLPLSNALTLAMWFALLIATDSTALLIAIACFTVLLYLDLLLRRGNVISSEYFTLRRNVSLIVIVSLLLMAMIEFR
ncbi:MAG: DUF3429 domain-containing protein [Woeseia sp.]